MSETVLTTVADVRKCGMRMTRLACVIAVALGGTAGVLGAPQAGAEGPMHQVTYSVFTERPFTATIYYRDTEPEIWSDYSHNPYMFSPRVEVPVGPDKPWVLNVQLSNPDEFAMVIGTSGIHPSPPNFHCVLAVDGQVVVQNAGAKGALCSIRNW